MEQRTVGMTHSYLLMIRASDGEEQMKKLAMSKKHRIKIRQAMKTLFKTTAIRYSIYSGLFIYNFNKIIARSNCQLSLDLAESKGIPEKNIYFCFIDYAKAFDFVECNTLENS